MYTAAVAVRATRRCNFARDFFLKTLSRDQSPPFLYEEACRRTDVRGNLEPGARPTKRIASLSKVPPPNPCDERVSSLPTLIRACVLISMALFTHLTPLRAPSRPPTAAAAWRTRARVDELVCRCAVCIQQPSIQKTLSLPGRCVALALLYRECICITSSASPNKFEGIPRRNAISAKLVRRGHLESLA